MPVTILFDQTNNLFDPVVFDCASKYSVEITETKQLFDQTNNLFDPVVFDTTAGGIIAITSFSLKIVSSEA